MLGTTMQGMQLATFEQLQELYDALLDSGEVQVWMVSGVGIQAPVGYQQVAWARSRSNQYRYLFIKRRASE